MNTRIQNKIIIACLFYSLTTNGRAAGTLSGFVRDFALGSGIPGTTVEFITPDKKILASTLTDTKGFYQKSDLPIGKMIIHYTKGGYLRRPTEKNLDILDASNQTQNVELISETQNTDAYIGQVAMRIKQNARTASSLRDGYLSQWNFLKEAGVAPELKSKVAKELNVLDPKSGDISEIKAYMEIPSIKFKSAKEALDLSARNLTPLPAEFKDDAGIPNDVKVDILRYHFEKTPMSKTEQKLFLENVESSFGKNTREEITRFSSPVP
jgi:hypothetical protein